MHYRYFIIYNVTGALLWVLVGVFSGYFFGNIPFVRNNFSTVILAIVVVSVLPAIVGMLRAKFKK